MTQGGVRNCFDTMHLQWTGNVTVDRVAVWVMNWTGSLDWLVWGF